MRLLLDTHALIWWLADDPRLSGRVRDILAIRENEILVSSATAWEISTKHRLGKLRGVEALVDDMPGWISEEGFSALAISVGHAQLAGSWPQAHRDPFDRMLAAQSTLEDLPLVTQDPVFEGFPINRVW